MSVTEVEPPRDIKKRPLRELEEPKVIPRSEDDAGSLGNTRTEFPLQGDDRRLARFARRAESSRILIANHLQKTGERLISPVESVNLSTGELRKIDREEARTLLPPRVARCSWALGQLVTLHGSKEAPAHYSGTERCGSISACPVCAPVIRNERAREISHAVTAHQKTGGALVFVTLTIRHQKKHQLAHTLDTVISGWQKLLRGRAWQQFTQRHEIDGFVRSVEITRGPNGWHPHIHSIFFLEKAPSLEELAEFEETIFDRWKKLVTKDDDDFMPDQKHGIDCQLVDGDGAVLASYLSKLQEEKTVSWGVAAELTRGDLKQARESSMVPFELIDAGRRDLWIEYVQATKGRRIITWSKGLKARYEVEEREDEQILDDAEKSPLAWVTTRLMYETTRKEAPVMLAVALTAVETENWELLHQLLPGSRPPNPPS